MSEDSKDSVRDLNVVEKAQTADDVNEKEPLSFVVQFAPDDPENPKNWSRARRWYLTCVASLLGLNATFASSAPAGVSADLMEQFHMSREVLTLTLSLFVAGYCVGPILWGPLSEQYGRRIIFLITLPVYTCFTVGCALSKNTASIIIFRLLCGMFSAAPLTNSGALISDVWDPSTRGKALAFFAMMPFVGPSIGPIVGGYISQAGVSWRWLFWILTLFGGVCLFITALTLPETYAPILLLRKAEKIRRETGELRWYAPMESMQQPNIRARFESTLGKPFKILFQEPMLIAVTAYMSFVYGIIYLLFEAYPIVFSEGHHFKPGTSGLMFIPLMVGICVGVIIYILVFGRRYERLQEKYSPNPVPPEARLEPAMYGAPIFVLAFFWFGWTSFPSISFWAPMMSGVIMGLSSIWIFVALFTHIIDTYLSVAASALASNTVVRSSAGAGFPLFASQMYNALTPRWASTLLGFVALAMLPIPFVLSRYGSHLRAKSRFAPTKL